ncbi:hypothetical protein JFN88_00885 [Paenibacillus sp. MAHUQ-46]|uniref:ATP synthase YMF19-like N-terminal domain-containing protein n=1 Tax=Paenibacillus roseus TaxID=2798579 RepID=A0A934IZF1_9BACL|nr:hypothetical protein [Paenibacillus roseus]MBJ6359880.1 hypothetical protein [Paenibacillus roseus]
MPQLDKVSYHTQFFWLLVGFVVLYIFITRYFLPSISRSYKSRQAVVRFAESKISVQTPIRPIDLIYEEHTNILKEIYDLGIRSVSQVKGSMASWLYENGEKVQKEYHKDFGPFYCSVLAQIVYANHLLDFHLLKEDYVLENDDYRYFHKSSDIASDLNEYLAAVKDFPRLYNHLFYEV